MEKLVLQIKYGGLGDHLFYSHIPRIAKQTKKFDKVFISNFSEFRHQDYKRVIWDLNPYIDGFIDEEGLYPEFDEVEEGINILDKIMLLLGLDDGVRYHDPEIYYKPTFLKKYSKTIIYDPNYVSFVGTISRLKLNIFFIFSGVAFRVKQMKIRNENAKNLFYKFDEINTPSLEDFCDLLVSSKQVYCLTSGTATLAAALGKSVVAFYGRGQKRMFHHSLRHKYVEV
jgi:hypothetical protein